MVVACLGWSAEGGACTCPCIDEKTPIVGLIACSGQQGAHAGQRAITSEALIVFVGGVDELGTQVEALESATFVAADEELMAVAQRVAAGLVGKLVEACTNDAGTQLARLVLSEHALIRQLGAARNPRQESYLYGILVFNGTAYDRGEQKQ